MDDSRRFRSLSRQTGIWLIDAPSNEFRWSRLLPLVAAGNLVVATAAWFIVGWFMN
jgi:hypothetical protein